MRSQLLGTLSKIEKVPKMDLERTAYDYYKTQIEDVWYELDYDAAVSLTIYAFAFDTDKTSRLNHLNLERRRSKRSFKQLTAPALENATRDMAQHPMLGYAKTVIKEETPDYDTDLDIQHDADPDFSDLLTRTKAVRGEGKKTRRQNEDQKKARQVCQKKKGNDADSSGSDSSSSEEPEDGEKKTLGIIGSTRSATPSTRTVQINPMPTRAMPNRRKR